MDPFFTTARGRLQQLKAGHEAGKLDAAQYDGERRVVERAIGDRLLAEIDGRAKPSRRLVATLSVVVLAIAAVGYWKTGSPSLARSGAPGADATAAAAPEPSASAATGLQQIAAMVDKLAARMKEHPDDAEGWVMLARSYSVLGRFSEAIPAYRRAAELRPDNAVVLADWADAVAAMQGSANNPESSALIARALAADPAQPKALALAGTAAYDRGDYAGAIAQWQRMAEQLPADSALLKQVQASIFEARQRVGAAAGPGAAGSAGAAPKADAPVANASVSGTVALAPELAGKASPGDTVFVFARAAGGASRMPLAVRRLHVSDLPLQFKLDDSMAMSPAAKLSSAKQVVVSARVSKSGNAIAQPGDLSGEAAPVAPGTAGVAVRIDRVVGSP